MQLAKNQDLGVTGNCLGVRSALWSKNCRFCQVLRRRFRNVNEIWPKGCYLGCCLYKNYHYMAIYSNLSRGHPKREFTKESYPKWPWFRLFIINCPDTWFYPKWFCQKKTARTPPLSPVKERGETPYRQLDAFGLVHSCLFRCGRISRRVVHCLVCNNDARSSPILIWLKSASQFCVGDSWEETLPGPATCGCVSEMLQRKQRASMTRLKKWNTWFLGQNAIVL